ncbi:hypothetical protein OY671_011755, partial [Metschnikowia pulcherrima]
RHPVSAPDAPRDPPAGGTGPQDRARIRRSHAGEGQRMRLRDGCRLPLSVARDHDGAGRAAGRRTVHAQADAGAVLERRSRTEPFRQGADAGGNPQVAVGNHDGAGSLFRRRDQAVPRKPQHGSEQPDRQRQSERRIPQPPADHGLLQHRRHGGARHHLQ